MEFYPSGNVQDALCYTDYLTNLSIRGNTSAAAIYAADDVFLIGFSRTVCCAIYKAPIFGISHHEPAITGLL